MKRKIEKKKNQYATKSDCVLFFLWNTESLHFKIKNEMFCELIFVIDKITVLSLLIIIIIIYVCEYLKRTI